MALPCSVPLLRAALWTESQPPEAPTPAWVDRAWGAPDVAFVEPLTRRRLGRMARTVFHCAARVAPPEGCRTVFASQHGDCERASQLMEDVAQAQPLSPTAFATSVHNAIPGQWSLLRQDRSPSSALAAGPDTFALGLLEAGLAWRRQPDRPVLYLFAEDRLPEVFQGFSQDQPVPHALALLIGEPGSVRLELAWEPALRDEDPPAALSLQALEALARGANMAPWTGTQGTWSLHVR